MTDEEYQIYKNKRESEIGCVFCHDSIKSQIYREYKYWRLVYNIFPYAHGHLMLIPKRHIEYIEDMDEKEMKEFIRLLKKTNKDMRNKFGGCMNLLRQNTFHQSIKHFHWHFISTDEFIKTERVPFIKYEL